jgi:transposase
MRLSSPGKDASTLERFSPDLSAHHGDPQAISEVCCDMSPAFIKGGADAALEAL